MWLTGFHGKLPGDGDFLTRGLPAGFAAFWDGWASRHLAARQRDGAPGIWPEGGLRLRLVSGKRVAVGVVIPGADRVGRRFPLAGFAIADTLPGPEMLDNWCDAAHAMLRTAVADQLAADDLDDRLAALNLPEGAADGPPMQLWRRGTPAEPCPPDAPDPLLDRLFSCSGSSSP